MICQEVRIPDQTYDGKRNPLELGYSKEKGEIVLISPKFPSVCWKILTMSVLAVSQLFTMWRGILGIKTNLHHAFGTYFRSSNL